jgi:isoprenylcysteine carboxyl methyltransferase (ICMT) family protein YpbQ
MNMVEDIGKIISNGFETYTKNLNICVPFILDFFVSVLLALLMAGFGIFIIFGSSLSQIESAKTPEALALLLLPLLAQHIIGIAILIAAILLVIFLIQAYFTSAAIGMAIQATGSGKSSLSTMNDAGRKNLVNMFFAEILFGLISLAGIVFIVPGAMKIDISQLMDSKNPESAALFFAGLMVWILYIIVISIVLVIFRYALVAENLGPIESISAAFEFFKNNKRDVVLLFIFLIVVSFGFFIVDQIMGSLPILNILWSFISFFISLIVIAPLTTIWWVRLYMVRTGKTIYFDDLLAHPNDFEKLKLQ